MLFAWSRKTPCPGAPIEKVDPRRTPSSINVPPASDVLWAVFFYLGFLKFLLVFSDFKQLKTYLIIRIIFHILGDNERRHIFQADVTMDEMPIHFTDITMNER